MALYLGDNKLKANMNGMAYCINFFSSIIVNNGIRLLSSEGYVLKDANGIYLIPKESDK